MCIETKVVRKKNVLYGTKCLGYQLIEVTHRLQMNTRDQVTTTFQYVSTKTLRYKENPDPQ